MNSSLSVQPEVDTIPKLLERNATEFSDGTAYRVNAGKLKLAGKSGTSQIVDIKSREEYESIRENPSLRDHAVFIGYAPYDNPRFAISVVIENGEGGGSVAGPVARDVLVVLLK